jgi:sialate O-acetylesterase
LPLYASVRLPALFADHMVIQRDEPVHVWGDAAAGETVAVAFRGKQEVSTADSLGRWTVQLPSGEAGGPFVLTIRGTNVIMLNDVLVGDVWIASGQSNMGFSLSEAENARQEMAEANLPEVRLLNVKQRYADYPQEDIAVTKPWSVCTPESAADFSAVAYFFAREVSRREQVPIGVIESAWGGTPAEAWTSMSALSQDASLMPVFSAWAAMANEEPKTRRAEAKERKDIEEQSGTAGDENLRLPWHPVSGCALQRNDRSTHTFHDSRSHLVPRRVEYGCTAVSGLRAALSDTHSGLESSLVGRQFSVSVRSDCQLSCRRRVSLAAGARGSARSAGAGEHGHGRDHRHRRCG